MDKTEPEHSGPTIPKNAESVSGEESERKPVVSATEINLGDFTRTQGLIKSLRLMLNDRIVVPVEEIAGGVAEAGRKFKVGELEQANQDVGRLYSAFRQKTGQWESQARGLEQQLRMKAAKNPKSVSIDTMNRMKSEQTGVRTRIRTADVQFRRLHQGLEQAFTNLQFSSTADAEPPNNQPSRFSAAFKAASIEDRPAIVKQWFEVEHVFQVDLSRGSTGGYTVRFDVTPPLDRLYYLATTAQVVRLKQLGKIVRVENFESGSDEEIKLREFVKHVQSGVWLLKTRDGGELP